MIVFFLLLFNRRSYNQTLRWKTLDPLALLDDFNHIFSSYGDFISGDSLRDLFNRVSELIQYWLNNIKNIVPNCFAAGDRIVWPLKHEAHILAQHKAFVQRPFLKTHLLPWWFCCSGNKISNGKNCPVSRVSLHIIPKSLKLWMICLKFCNDRNLSTNF